jgi:hypothetical protein
MNHELLNKPDFSINEEDLPPVISINNDDIEKAVKSIILPPLIQVSLQDIAAIEAQILRLTENDLPPILTIHAKDLPPIVKIGLDDLIPDRDLTNVSTNCYHGTSRAAAEKIVKEGFRVGPGAASGYGIYFSVGGMTIARSFLKDTPCIIRAKVDWGRVVYGDIPASLTKYGGKHDSLLLSSKYSEEFPTIGIVLAPLGTYVKPPRIEVMELIDPHKK